MKSIDNRRFLKKMSNNIFSPSGSGGDLNDLELWIHYIKSLPAVILAILGGFVRIIQSTEEFSIARLITGIISAGFVGILLYLFMYDLNLSPTFKAAIIGISGYAFGDILPLLNKIVKQIITNKIGIAIEDRGRIENIDEKNINKSKTETTPTNPTERR